MPGLDRRSIAELIKKSNIGRDQTVRFIIVIQIHGGEFVLRCMKDVCIPAFLVRTNGL